MLIKLEIKSYNMISIQRLQKYQPYHQELASINILLVKKYYLLIKKQVIEQAKFTFSPLGKASEKQIKIIEDQEKK